MGRFRLRSGINNPMDGSESTFCLASFKSPIPAHCRPCHSPSRCLSWTYALPYHLDRYAWLACPLDCPLQGLSSAEILSRGPCPGSIGQPRQDGESCLGLSYARSQLQLLRRSVYTDSNSTLGLALQPGGQAQCLRHFRCR